MFTIDASVHINALNTAEAGSTESQAFLELIHRQSKTVCSPTLLLVEVAASVARIYNDPNRGLALAETIWHLPGQVWIQLDGSLAHVASKLGAEHRLRGADAVYAAVTWRNNTTLVTLDKQQLEHLAGVIPVQRPVDMLKSLK